MVAETVATPLEQQVNGVQDMLYMSSQGTGDGKLAITVTFKLGTNLDTAEVLTQNRVQVALPRLPEDVQRQGVVVKKATPNILLAVHMLSPDGSRDQLYVSNYTTLHVKDELSRLPGVGDVQLFGDRDYAMRIWLDPDRIAAYGMTGDDVVAALRAQNVQVSAGILNQPPLPSHEAFQLNVQTQGRLQTPEQFGDVIVKTDADGHVTRVRDVARIEIGGQDYGSMGYLDHLNALPLLIFAQPGSNALATEHSVRAKMQALSKDFPPGIGYQIVYDPTEFIQQSVNEVIRTILVAILLVVAVVIVFLQTWRASLIPVVAIPVSLIGAFIILAALGFSLNNLSLFGLVLAVGIVVDDAIVVVENVERNIAAGLSPREAAHRTMDEVGGALIAIALTLCAVFVPTAFISGISGQFFRQFAVTIAASTLISCVVSLTLSPALCALLFRPHATHVPASPSLAVRAMRSFFRVFNRGFEALAAGYGRLTTRLVRTLGLVLLVYAGLIALAAFQFARAPTGFIPEQDQGYSITVLQLPPGASLDRSDRVLRQVVDIMLHTPGVAHAVPFTGLDATTFTDASNSATVFATFAPFEQRVARGLSGDVIIGELRQRLSAVQGAFVLTIAPPPVQGIGSAGGFKMMVEDRTGQGSEALAAAAARLVAAANQSPEFAGVFTLFSTRTPSVFADIDRERAEKLGLTPASVFDTLQVYLGSAYINDFNYLGRTFEVVAQADGQFRRSTDDIARLKTRNAAGDMVPIGSVARFRNVTAPYRVPRYDLYPAAEVMGAAAPGVPTRTALATMEPLAQTPLPHGFRDEWPALAFQERLAGVPTLVVFGAAALFVFLVLAAQYESWKLPMAVVLIVPMCLLAAVTGLRARGLSIDILAQIGFVVLVGLAAKNAILIVEFARQAETEGGMGPAQAAVHAARTRLRPILMTSFAFILGVAPLAVASGAGAEMRQSLGTAVFFGMLGVTGFGLLFTPAFYTVMRRLGLRQPAPRVMHPVNR